MSTLEHDFFLHIYPNPGLKLRILDLEFDSIKTPELKFGLDNVI